MSFSWKIIRLGHWRLKLLEQMDIKLVKTWQDILNSSSIKGECDIDSNCRPEAPVVHNVG